MKTPSASAILIRADAPAGLGSGHILRMVALGQAWRSNGGRVIFVTNTVSEVLLSRLHSEGFEVHQIVEAHPAKEDIEKTLCLGQACAVRHIVLDGYHFDRVYVQHLREAGFYVAMVEDINQQDVYGPDVLLVPAPDAKNYGFCTAPWTKKLFGVEYALIRKEFLRARKPQRRFGPSLHVLVSFGGEDAPNATGLVLQSLVTMGWSGRVSVVLGALNLHRKRLMEFLHKSSLDSDVLPFQSNMADVLGGVDVLIGAGGGTCWEACFLGVPSFCLAISKNQESVLESLSRRNVLVYSGNMSTLNDKEFTLQLQKFLQCPSDLQSMREHALQLVDGKGVEKFIYEMLRDSYEKEICHS